MSSVALPRITPTSTHVDPTVGTPATPQAATAPPAMYRQHTSNSLYGSHVYTHPNSVYQVYPPFVTEKQTGARVPPRVDPLHPHGGQGRRGRALETVEPHWHNDRRRIMMQQREWYRYHGTWSKSFYGSPAEKEGHKKVTRTVLKQQMKDKLDNDKVDFRGRLKESRSAVQYDNQCVKEDTETRHKKHEYLKTYRDSNKTIMEQTWMKNRERSFLETAYDREQLKFEPINWSHTLK